MNCQIKTHISSKTEPYISSKSNAFNYKSLVPSNSRPQYKSSLRSNQKRIGCADVDCYHQNNNYVIDPIYCPPAVIYCSKNNYFAKGNRKKSRANPIRHWRKQLIPLEGSGHGKFSQANLIDTPGSSSLYQNQDLSLEKNTNCPSTIRTYLNKGLSNDCYKNIRKNRIRNLTKPLNNSYMSSKAYLESRVKTYDSRITFENTNVCLQNSKYVSLYLYDRLKNPNSIPDCSQCPNTVPNCSNNEIIYDCSGQVSIYYKPNNPQFGQDGAVSSQTLIQNLKYNMNQCNQLMPRNKWGQFGHLVIKKPYCTNTHLNYLRGYHTTCIYPPLQPHEKMDVRGGDSLNNPGSIAQRIRGTGTYIGKQDPNADTSENNKCLNRKKKGGKTICLLQTTLCH